MSRKFNTIWPLPVYVATFADGEMVRLSFGSPQKKPLDFERGRRMVCHAARNGVFPARVERHEKWGYVMARYNEDGSIYREAQYYEVPSRADIVAGHVEVGGQSFPDPHFAPAAAPVLVVARARKSAYERALALLPELSFAELEDLARAVSDVTDEKLAA
jgi:hypothetical protein